jgi:hypothetical protein
MAKYFRLPLYTTQDREVIALFTWNKPSGDGWNEPRDEGGPEFQGAMNPNGSAVDAATWEWAEEEFATKRAEAAEIAQDYDDMCREYAADARRDWK